MSSKQEVYPPNLLKHKYGIGKSKYYKKNNILICRYRQKQSQKKPVLLLSTFAKPKSVSRLNKKADEISKPDIVEIYNKFLGGVDTSDQMQYTYLDERRTLKYWKKVVFHFFGRMILNAYIFYKENYSGSKMLTRLQFTSSIVESIEEE